MKVARKSEKSALASRTVQLNTVFAVAATIAALDPSVFALLGPKGVAVGAALIALANVVLRFKKDPTS